MPTVAEVAETFGWPSKLLASFATRGSSFATHLNAEYAVPDVVDCYGFGYGGRLNLESC